MKTIKTIGLLWIILLLLVGCVQIQNPVVTFVGQKIDSIDLEKVKVNLNFNVYNPNGLGVEGAELSYSVFVKGIECFQGKNAKINLLGNQTVAITVPVEVAYSKLFASSVEMVKSIASGEKELPYEVRGTVTVPYVGFPINIPVKQQGTLPLPEVKMPTSLQNLF